MPPPVTAQVACGKILATARPVSKYVSPRIAYIAIISSHVHVIKDKYKHNTNGKFYDTCIVVGTLFDNVTC